jgi:hypothetical protein
MRTNRYFINGGFLLLLLCNNFICKAQFVRMDLKTTAQVTANGAAATAAEAGVTASTTEVRKKNALIAAKSTVSQLVKAADMAAKQNVGDLKSQSLSYTMICKEIVNIGYELNQTYEVAAKNPTRLGMCVVAGTKVILETKGIVDKVVYLACNGKVPNPFNNVSIEDIKKGKLNQKMEENGTEKDGANLLSARERLNIMNDALYNLRRIKRSLTLVKFRLMTSYTFADILRESLPQEYYWQAGMKLAFDDTMRDIKRFTN